MIQHRPLTSDRITKVIGESFKIHAQALIGWEDSVAPPNGDAEVSPSISQRPIETLGLQTAY